MNARCTEILFLWPHVSQGEFFWLTKRRVAHLFLLPATTTISKPLVMDAFAGFPSLTQNESESKRLFLSTPLAASRSNLFMRSSSGLSWDTPEHGSENMPLTPQVYVQFRTVQNQLLKFCLAFSTRKLFSEITNYTSSNPRCACAVWE